TTKSNVQSRRTVFMIFRCFRRMHDSPRASAMYEPGRPQQIAPPSVYCIVEISCSSKLSYKPVIMRLSASVRDVAKAAPVAVLAVFFLLVALSAAPAQQSAQKPSANEEPVETLKVDVNVVNLYFNVKDKHGK